MRLALAVVVWEFRRMNDLIHSRRGFLGSALAASALAVAPKSLLGANGDVSLKGRVFKTLKIGMIRVKGSLTEKFKAAKEAGFEGVELNAPGINVAEAKKAIQESGLPVDGSVNSGPGACGIRIRIEVRKKALTALKDGLRQTREVGGHSLLLVVHGRMVRRTKSGSARWRTFSRPCRWLPNSVSALPERLESLLLRSWRLLRSDGGQASAADEFRSPWVGMV